jgi:hypothetical protein
MMTLLKEQGRYFHKFHLSFQLTNPTLALVSGDFGVVRDFKSVVLACDTRALGSLARLSKGAICVPSWVLFSK